MKLSPSEIKLANIAYQVVKDAGGNITFEQYDKAMANKQYIVPFNWAYGWGLSPIEKKSNDAKLCAFAACELGWIVQKEDGYYINNGGLKSC